MTTMKWVKASEELPHNQQELLVKFVEAITIAQYDCKQDKFVLKSGIKIDSKSKDLSWAEIIGP
jgi:hypothetical protein